MYKNYCIYHCVQLSASSISHYISQLNQSIIILLHPSPHPRRNPWNDFVTANAKSEKTEKK